MTTIYGNVQYDDVFDPPPQKQRFPGRKVGNVLERIAQLGLHGLNAYLQARAMSESLQNDEEPVRYYQPPRLQDANIPAVPVIQIPTLPGIDIHAPFDQFVRDLVALDQMRAGRGQQQTVPTGRSPLQDVTKDIDDLRHNIIHKMVSINPWANADDIASVMHQKFRPGGEWDVFDQNKSNFPGLDDNGNLQQALYRGKVVHGPFLNHHLAGIAMAAAGFKPD